MNELMFQAGVKGISERSELIPSNLYLYLLEKNGGDYTIGVNLSIKMYNPLLLVVNNNYSG